MTDGQMIQNKQYPEWGIFLVKGNGFGLVIISESGNESYFDPQWFHLWEVVS